MCDVVNYGNSHIIALRSWFEHMSAFKQVVYYVFRGFSFPVNTIRLMATTKRLDKFDEREKA